MTLTLITWSSNLRNRLSTISSFYQLLFPFSTSSRNSSTTTKWSLDGSKLSSLTCQSDCSLRASSIFHSSLTLTLEYSNTGKQCSLSPLSLLSSLSLSSIRHRFWYLKSLSRTTRAFTARGLITDMDHSVYNSIESTFLLKESAASTHLTSC